MDKFYLTKEFYQAVACVTVLIIFLVLFFFGNIFESTRYFKSTREQNMSSDFVYLKVLIQCSETSEHLEKFKVAAEEFFNKYFWPESDNMHLKHYYSRLLEVISEKEKQFNELQEAV